MTGFGDAAERKAAEERRRMRRAEARRRVEAGENTSPPPPATAPSKPARTRTGRGARPAAVDPLAAPGAHFAVWRSVQHFCTSDSRPDAEGTDLDVIVGWSNLLQPFRLRQRIVARLDAEGAWLPVCYAKDGRREPITQAQADRYRDARLGETVLSGGAQAPLKDSDHPESTEKL